MQKNLGATEMLFYHLGPPIAAASIPITDLA